MAAGWRRCTGVLPTDVPFRRWTLGFRQSSFSRIAQALRGRTVHAFRRSPLHVHALVPTSFRIRVSRSPRSHLPRTPANFVGNSLGAYHGAHFRGTRLKQTTPRRDTSSREANGFFPSLDS